MIQWNEEKGCLCDEMGLPISLSEANEWMQLIAKHQALTPQHLHSIWHELMDENYAGIKHTVSKSVRSFK